MTLSKNEFVKAMIFYRKLINHFNKLGIAHKGFKVVKITRVKSKYKMYFENGESLIFD